MTCALDLTVIDLNTGLPIDIGIPFGANKSDWGGVVKASGVPLEFSCSEQDKASIDGVRIFWTDDLGVFTRFLRYCMDNHFLTGNMPHAEDEFQLVYSRWIDRKLRFILDMI
jgi:hypothetical protein